MSNQAQLLLDFDPNVTQFEFHFERQNLLLNALSKGCISSFRLALQIGANPMIPDQNNNITYERALETYGCAKFVEECLLHYECKPNYINPQLNKAAINFAADSCDPQIISALLRQRGVQVDHKYLQLTPLNSLAKRLTTENVADIAECMKLLLKYGASPDVYQMAPLQHVLNQPSLDETKKREIAQLLQEYGAVDHAMNYSYRAYQPQILTLEMSFQAMRTHLQSDKEAAFLSHFEHSQQELTPRQHLILLADSIIFRQHNAFEQLLQVKFSADCLSSQKSLPTEIATKCGNWWALQRLLRHEVLNAVPPGLLISCIFNNNLKNSPHNESCNHRKCLTTILNSKSTDIDYIDESDMTPLEHALVLHDDFAIKELLKHGAQFMRVLKDMPAHLLEAHFDDCITTNEQMKSNPDFQIIMNYTHLTPLAKKSDNVRRARNEMTVVAAIAHSKKHRQLLQHPVITGFLFINWLRFSFLYFVNFLCYSLFAVSIISHATLKFCDSRNEELVFVFEQLSWIGLTYLILRELLQIIISPIIYFTSLLSYMEMALIVLSTMTRCATSLEEDTQRDIAALTILLTALDFCFLVGSLPIPFISIHMTMLNAVFKSFLKFFSFFSIFVITFSMCFFILFSRSDVSTEAAEAANNTDNEFSKFATPSVALVKTIVMFTGELDASDIDFRTFHNYLFFLIFIFLIPIVLFNLLNALAVSDIQVIRAKAEINDAFLRTKLLHSYEKLLNGQSKIITFIQSFKLLRAICKRFLNLNLNYTEFNQIIILPNFYNEIILGNSINETIKRTHASIDSRTIELAMIVMERKSQKQHASELEAEQQKKHECQQRNERQEKDNNIELRLQSIEKKLCRTLEMLQERQAGC